MLEQKKGVQGGGQTTDRTRPFVIPKEDVQLVRQRIANGEFNVSQKTFGRHMDLLTIEVPPSHPENAKVTGIPDTKRSERKSS